MNKEYEKAVESAMDMMNMYKQGYVDGYSKAKGKKTKWEKVKYDCAIDFQKVFRTKKVSLK